MYSDQQSCLIRAIDVVLDWDIPDHLIPMAVSDQMKLLAVQDCEPDYDFADGWHSVESFVSFQ